MPRELIGLGASMEHALRSKCSWWESCNEFGDDLGEEIWSVNIYIVT
jgi:hypothetical protein